MFKRLNAITLIELLISIVLISLIIFGLSNINIFSRLNLTNAERRSRIQNEVTLILEHMGKNVPRGIGDQFATANQPIQLVNAGTFRVRVDTKIPSLQTLRNYADDVWCIYNWTPTTYNLSFKCTNSAGTANTTCPGYTNKPLSLRITAFNYVIGNNGTSVTVSLTSRFTPSLAASTDNPDVMMNATMRAYNCAAN